MGSMGNEKITSEKINWPKEVRRVMIVIVAAVIMAFNLKCFARYVGLFPGGFTGVTLLVQKIGEEFFGVAISYTLVNLILNSIPIIISFRFIGKRFTLYSCIVIVLSSVLLDVIKVPVVTDDILLAAVFGGMINAVAVCMCLLSNATSGGTDFIAIFFSEKLGIDFWNYIFVGNMIVLGVAGVLFGWDKALYSIIFQYTSTQVLQGLYKRYQKQTMLIITDSPDEVYQGIRDATNHDATLFKGVGCYSGKECNMVYSVVSSDEIRKVIADVKKHDEGAFINIIKTEQINGRFYQRPNK